MITNRFLKQALNYLAVIVCLTVSIIPIGFVQANGYVTDLPFNGSQVITCVWHEACLTPPTPGNGVDFGLYYETVYASGKGTVYLAGWDNTGWGYQVVIKHPDGTYTRYAHLSYYFVSQNSRVGNGSPIGYSGNSGTSTGAHLHFEMYNNSTLSSSSSTPFTPIYGLRNSGIQYSYAQIVDNANLNHDRYDNSTPLIDNSDSRFSTTGIWYSQSGLGFGRVSSSSADMKWTYANGSTVSSTAKWIPLLPANKTYEVFAFIPTNYGTTPRAHYKIISNGTITHKYINQNQYANDWVSLGSYYGTTTSGSLTIELQDNTTEPAGSSYIAADAIMFVPTN